MEFFALDITVAALETDLSKLHGQARLPVLIALAWQLRQRDHTRALMLANEADGLLIDLSSDDPVRVLAAARLALIMAEVRWLFGQLGEAERQASLAISEFERLNDRIGAGDGKWLLASIWTDLGKKEEIDNCLAAALDDYRAAGDQDRVDIAAARCLLRTAFRNARVAATGLAEQFDPARVYSDAAEGWVSSARAIVKINTGDEAIAIKFFLRAQQCALSSGQIRLAVIAASNAADSFACLGELAGALECVERASILARANGAPTLLGLPLMQHGNILRMLDRHVEAKASLSEALEVVAGLKNPQSLGIVSEYLGELSLDMGNAEEALDYFVRAERYFAAALEGPIPLLRCWRGQADASLRLGLMEVASAQLAVALTLAEQEGTAIEQIKILRVYADLYRQSTLQAPNGMNSPRATLHYLREAVALANTIEGYILPSELLDDVARAYAACGDYEAAYASTQAAAAARDSKRLDDARNRAIAMQVRQETARANAETDYQRELVAAEAKRVAALEADAITLETLGTIGREITARLNAEAIFATLSRHLNQLLDAMCFDIYLLDADGYMLDGVFGIENGKPSPLISIPIDDSTSLNARCVREREELVIHRAEFSVNPPCEVVPGTLDTLSMVFAPLSIGDRLLGVMSIQTMRAQAYGERECSIFRTLCAYGAIALDNAAAYSVAEKARQLADQALDSLRQAQFESVAAENARAALETQLRESQKMEAIGTLAGGIAHDFNNILATILGNAELARQDVSGNMEVLESLDEIRKAGTRARDLVQQILSFSRRQPTDRTEMSLVPIVEESIRLLRATLPARVTLKAHCDSSVPQVLADVTQMQQVVLNLATNAMQSMQGGQGHIDIFLDSVSLDANLAESHSELRKMYERAPGRAVRLAVSDNGSGMDAATIDRIFEPFFTTKLVGEGTGLGLSVVHGIMRGHEGAIIVDSEPGRGSTFSIYLSAVQSINSSALSTPVRTDAGLTTRSTDQHILYLDDDESLVFLVKRLLERRGIRVSAHIDQHEALAALRADPDGVDLVVTDYNMPGLSGLDIAREVKLIRADLPVAIASGFIDEALSAGAADAGVVELIFKANVLEDLCDAFERLLK